MLRSLRSGDIIDRRWLRFAFPSTWHYDVLRGLDYLRSADVEPGDEILEALEIIEKHRHQNGLWPVNVLHTDRIAFDMDAGVGRASYWNTLRACRVLDWAQGRARSQRSSGSPSASVPIASNAQAAATDRGRTAL